MVCGGSARISFTNYMREWVQFPEQLLSNTGIAPNEIGFKAIGWILIHILPLDGQIYILFYRSYVYLKITEVSIF